MALGNMRARLTLQTETQVADGAGGYVLSWTDAATVWAEIKPLDGREIYTAAHLESRVTHEITLRYRSDIAADMRATDGVRYFNIRAAFDPDGKRRFLKLLAEEGAPT